MLREVRQEHPDRPFDVVILSDHGVEGGEPLINVRKPVLKALKKAGYRYKKKLKRPDDVVLTPYGLVSNLEAYTRDEIKPQVAEVLADVPGVDLCVFETPSGWVIEGTDGKAVFRRHDTPEGKCWSYEPLHGDPLHYLPLIDAFSQRTGKTTDCLPDEAWFEASADCEYPDAFFRLEQAFALVENPASVACSLCPGYMYGARMTDYGSKIASGPLALDPRRPASGGHAGLPDERSGRLEPASLRPVQHGSPALSGHPRPPKTPPDSNVLCLKSLFSRPKGDALFVRWVGYTRRTGPMPRGILLPTQNREMDT